MTLIGQRLPMSYVILLTLLILNSICSIQCSESIAESQICKAYGIERFCALPPEIQEIIAKYIIENNPEAFTHITIDTPSKVIALADHANHCAKGAILDNGNTLALPTEKGIRPYIDENTELSLFDITSGEYRESAQTPTWQEAIALSDDDKMIATIGRENVYIWKYPSFDLLQTVHIGCPVDRVLFFAGGSKLLIATSTLEPFNIRFWDLKTKSWYQEIPEPDRGTSGIRFNDDETRLAVASEDFLFLYDPTGEPHEVMRYPLLTQPHHFYKSGYHRALHFLNNDEIIVITEAGIYVWDLIINQLTRRYYLDALVPYSISTPEEAFQLIEQSRPTEEHPHFISHIDFSATQTMFTACSTDGVTALWDYKANKKRVTILDREAVATNSCLWAFEHSKIITLVAREKDESEFIDDWGTKQITFWDIPPLFTALCTAKKLTIQQALLIFLLQEIRSKLGSKAHLVRYPEALKKEMIGIYGSFTAPEKKYLRCKFFS